MNTFSDHRSFFTCDSFSFFLENLQIGAALILITEPRAILKLVQLSIAFSAKRMGSEQIKVNSVSAIEKSGSLIDIVTSKTSALTEGKMTVASFYVGRDR
jgi:Ca2+-transporting ATPase